MNGIHDMGGMHGFGPVPVDDDARFHAEWERIVFAMGRTIRALGVYNIEESRHGIERMDPTDYLASSYFERWLASLELKLTENGYLSETEIAAAVRRARALAEPAELVPDHRVAALEHLLVSQGVFDTARIDARATAFAKGERTAEEFVHGERSH